LPIYLIAHGVPPWNLTTGEELDPTLGTVQFLDPVMDLLGFLGVIGRQQGLLPSRCP
jgi:hypothetical protein